MTTRKIMLDIETMSTHTSNALVLSIGAVRWEWNRKEVIFLTSSLWVMNPFEQMALGRETTQNTMKWWQNQTPAAQAHWRESTSSSTIAEMARELNNFVKPTGGRADFETVALGSADIEVWANGIVFDLGNIAAMYSQAGLGDVPWRYNAAMDARTIYRKTPQLRTRPVVSTGAVHDPVQDCKDQIWGVWEHTPIEDLPAAPEYEGVQ